MHAGVSPPGGGLRALLPVIVNVVGVNAAVAEYRAAACQCAQIDDGPGRRSVRAGEADYLASDRRAHDDCKTAIVVTLVFIILVDLEVLRQTSEGLTEARIIQGRRTVAWMADRCSPVSFFDNESPRGRLLPRSPRTRYLDVAAVAITGIACDSAVCARWFALIRRRFSVSMVVSSSRMRA